MAKYRVTAVSFIGGRTVHPGEVIEYAGIPGSKLDPVDDEARAAKEVAARKQRQPFRDRPTYAPVAVTPQPRNLAEIPTDWESLKAAERVELANSMGATVKKSKDADEFIKAEIAKRATV